MIKRTFEKEIRLSPEEIAQEIWMMDSDEQIKMFTWLVANCKYYQMVMQMEYITDSLKDLKSEDIKYRIKEMIYELDIRVNPERFED